MSKLCGILSKDRNISDSIPNVIVKMTNILNRTDYCRTDTWCDSHIGLGHISLGVVNTENQPISDDRGKCIIFAGKIFDYSHLKNQLISRGYNFRYSVNDAEFLLHFYTEFQSKGLEELNGIFAAAIWNPNDKELVLINDRYGFRPVYYFSDKARRIVLFGSELKALLETGLVERIINWEAWDDFLHLNFLLGDETFFGNIKRLPPATVLRVKGESIQWHQYWNYNHLDLKSNFDEKKDTGNLVDLFRQAVKRRLPSNGKAMVLLSGGLDSRLIAAELRSQKVDFVTYTSRKFAPAFEDPILAAKVAGALKIENHFFNLPANFLELYESRKNFFLDFESDEHAWLLPLIESLPPDIKINYDGIAGDIMLKGLFLTPDKIRLVKERKIDALVKYLSKEHGFWPSNTELIIFKDYIREKFNSENFFGRVQDELSRYLATTNPLSFFYLNNRTRREIALAPFILNLDKHESFCPYLDNEFFEFAMAIPPEEKLKDLRNKMIKMAYPELADIPYTGTKSEIQHLNNDIDIKKQMSRYFLNFEKTFILNSDGNIFNKTYLIPRFVLDLIADKLSTSGLSKNNSNRVLHRSWLLNFLLFFDGWLKYSQAKAD